MNAFEDTPTGETKICPFCAETIKAAAIKCRFCQSDLPEPVAEEPRANDSAEPDVQDEPAPAHSEPSVPAWTASPAPATERASDPGARRLGVLCGVLALLLVAAVATLVITQRPSDPDTASNGQVSDAEFRSAAMSAAAANATTVLSYSYQTLAENQKAARDVLTPKFAEEYDSVMVEAGKKATAAKLIQKATVLTSAIESITENKADVLLTVNTVTTADGSKQQQLLQNRVKMTLERKDGDWTVSKMVRF